MSFALQRARVPSCFPAARCDPALLSEDALRRADIDPQWLRELDDRAQMAAAAAPAVDLGCTVASIGGTTVPPSPAAWTDAAAVAVDLVAAFHRGQQAALNGPACALNFYNDWMAQGASAP